MLRFGSDKPDLRYGLEIEDATELTRGSEFGVFANAPAVRYLVLRRRSRVPSSTGSRRSRRSGVRRDSHTSSTTRAATSARRSRSSSPRRSSRRSAASPARPCSSAPASRRRWRACSAPCASTSRRELELIETGRVRVRVDHRLPDVRLVRGRRALGGRPPSLHASRRRSGRTPSRATRRPHARSPTTSS